MAWIEFECFSHILLCSAVVWLTLRMCLSFSNLYRKSLWEMTSPIGTLDINLNKDGVNLSLTAAPVQDYICGELYLTLVLACRG